MISLTGDQGTPFFYTHVQSLSFLQNVSQIQSGRNAGGKKKPSVGLGDIRKEEKVKGDSPGEGRGGGAS